MTISDAVQARLLNQQITDQKFGSPAEVVKWLGAVQAQDYRASLWAVGLRTQGASENSIKEAIARRQIVRTWPMRGTLHFVASADARWMLQLMAERVANRMNSNYRQAGLDQAVFNRVRGLFIKYLQGGRKLMRRQIYDLLEADGISTKNTRGLYLLGFWAQMGLICFGPHQGKQPTFVLLDEWVAPTKQWEKEEALAELTKRYFTGHGPAQLQDLVWWSGLTQAEVKIGLKLAADHLISENLDGRTYWFAPNKIPKPEPPLTTHLLASYDEYLVGYKDRTAVLDPAYFKDTISINGIFSPAIVIDGRVVGIWKRSFRSSAVVVSPSFFTKPNSRMIGAVASRAEQFGKFVDLPVLLDNPKDQNLVCYD